VNRSDAARALRENARALHVISTRRSVQRDDEYDIRTVAANIEAIALELATTKPKGE
jgi:hypothetical protein